MTYRRQLRIRYPLSRGRLMLRTDDDWDRLVEADEVRDDGTCFVFELESERPYLYFQASLVVGDVHTHQTGKTSLIVLTNRGPKETFPHFWSGGHGVISEILELESRRLGRPVRYRVYMPPGYQENTLCRYPVLYMHDGKNLFFPEEAFLYREWEVDETLDRLDAMSVIDPCLVVGVYAPDGSREQDYTRPGYETYGEALVHELKPLIDARFRTRPEAVDTSVAGSSLGGVVSFYMAWQWPEVFGAAACLSSTFSWRDDLLVRVMREPPRPVRFYLDSGWPGDNYEVTLSMALALAHRGYVYGRDLLYFAFPRHEHSEEAWRQRLHLPLQFFHGKFRHAALPDGEHALVGASRLDPPGQPGYGDGEAEVDMQLDADSLYYTACVAALRDGKLEEGESSLLKTLRGSLGIEDERAERIAAEAKENAAGSDDADRPLDPRELFETACRIALLDGVLEYGEAHNLTELADVLGFSRQEATEILEQVEPDLPEAEVTVGEAPENADEIVAEGF